MLTYDTNIKSSLMQEQNNKVFNDINQSKRTEEISEQEDSKKDVEKTQQLIKEIENIEEVFSTQAVDYDPIIAQEQS